MLSVSTITIPFFFVIIRHMQEIQIRGIRFTTYKISDNLKRNFKLNVQALK